ncbi:MAG: hypothetical protein ACRDN6_07425 [Gaiellaceae bacterium]
MAILLAGGCGGNTEATLQTAAGTGYRFEAPQDWRLERAGRTLSAVSGDGRAAVSVTTFRLARPYRTELRPEVFRELDRVADELAGKLGGAVQESSDVTVGGLRGRHYRFSGASDGTRRIAFVLQGRREFQLLCRFADVADEPVCEQLLASFRLR